MDPEWTTIALPWLSRLAFISWDPVIYIGELFASGLVDEDERELLLGLPRHTQRIIALLIKIVPWKGVGAYERFQRALGFSDGQSDIFAGLYTSARSEIYPLAIVRAFGSFLGI